MPRGVSRMDEEAPICPACGVTMGLVVRDDGEARFACLECGFSDDAGRAEARGRPRPG